MAFGSEGLMSVTNALRQEEKEAGKTGQVPNLDHALILAKTESDHPSIAEAWRNIENKGSKGDPQHPGHNVASHVQEDSLQPQAVGHALVQACRGGYIRCVRRFRKIQNEKLSGSLLVALFNAFGLLKAAEAGHAEVVEELLQPMKSASTAMMGYMLATEWKDQKGSESYPFVEKPVNPPSSDWMRKLMNCRSTLPAATPASQSKGWDLRGLHENPDEVIRASYATYLLWRTSVIAGSHCHYDIFGILLNRRQADGVELTKSLQSIRITRGHKKGQIGLDNEVMKILDERKNMDNTMYQLVEEYSTKNYHDAMLYTLWAHIQRKGKDVPLGPGAGKPKCVAQALNGIWEMILEVPLLVMPVEYAMKDEELYKRYKHLTLLFNQKAKVNIQLVATVEAQSSYLQVTVAVKHVRFKAENSRWDELGMGHFPTALTLSVTPQTKEGSSVTMTNSSSNTVYKIGHGENISVGSGAGDGATRGLAAGLRASAAVMVNSTMKATPWRFEQHPIQDTSDRGGSFVWTLQSMKGIPFERSNPHRMADTNSKWNWGRRVPGNPLDELPFTSEGGVIFTGNEFTDTMMWRFPKSMEGKRLRWTIAGQIHSTFTTSRYFETRVASFSGEIDERLRPMEDTKGKDKDAEKGKKSEKKETAEIDDKNKDSEKGEVSKPKLGKINTSMRTDFEEYLEFKRYKEERMRMMGEGQSTQASNNEGEFKEDTVRESADAARVKKYGSSHDEIEENTVNLKLDPEEGRSSLQVRPSLVRVKANNGR